MPADRLQKLIAQSGLASRRSAEAWVRDGRVTVDGVVVTDLSSKVDPARQAILVDGKPLPVRSRKRTIMLYKPIGVVSTARDPQGRETVVQLARSAGLSEPGERLYPVGRLDAESEGLILLTNDGDLALRLTHPRYEHEKEYFVLVAGRVTEDQIRSLEQGGIVVVGRRAAPAFIREVPVTQLPPGPKRIAADYRPGGQRLTWLQMVLREGRKRQIRLMCDAVGLEVVRLIRTRVGLVPLGDMQPRTGRLLAPLELAFLSGPD